MLGRTNSGSGGSGGGMELTIIVDTVRPAKATHNMIWVDSDVEATSYALTAAEPENPEPGALWISIGDGGKTKVVSPVGDNWITVYLLSAKQYIDGEWVAKVAKRYQNGEWTQFSATNLYLYNNGDQCVDITGGWKTAKQCTITHEDDRMVVSAASGAAGAATITNMVDLTDFSTLVFIGYAGKNVANNLLYVGDSNTDSFNYITGSVANIQIPTSTTPVEVRLDISTISGAHYVGCGASASTVYLYEMYLEK